MKRSEAIKAIKESNGQWFSVRFIRRTDGEVRYMNARTGVRKHLRGGEAAYDFKAKKLISVFDKIKKDYRVIPEEGIIEFNGVAVEED